MKKWGNVITLFLVICAFLATQAFAAEKVPSAKVKGEAAQKATMGQQAYKVSEIIGKKAVSQKGEDLGKIEDIVLTKEGCLDFIVLAPEGWFGGGDRYIPIPWKLVKAGVQAEKIVVGRDRSQLEKAPAIEKDKWPQYIITESEELYGKIREFFGGEK